MTVDAREAKPHAPDSSRARLGRALLIGVALVFALRIIWYLSVAVAGLPFVPARDDQPSRQHIVDEIESGRMLAPTFVGFRRIQLSPLDADLTIGGGVEVDREDNGVLTVTFWTQTGILGKLTGFAFRSDGQTPTSLSDPDVTARPIGDNWFALSG